MATATAECGASPCPVRITVSENPIERPMAGQARIQTRQPGFGNTGATWADRLESGRRGAMNLGRISREQEQAESDLDDIFGAPVYSYSRQQAIDDGILVDLMQAETVKIVREAGFR